MDPMQMIPEAWRAWLALAAMYAFGAVALITLAAHTLLPIAKRIEQWAIASSVTWDNKPAAKAVEILAWIVGLTDLLWALPRFTVGRSGPAEKREERSKLNGARPPSDGALALALCVIAAACSIAASGCGASAYQGHARAATIAAATLSATGDVIDAARDSALDAVEAAHPEHGVERTAALEAEAARWRPAGVALDDARVGLLTWIDAAQLAQSAGEDGGLLAHLDAIAARFVALFNAVITTAQAAGATGLSPFDLDALLGGAP